VSGFESSTSVSWILLPNLLAISWIRLFPSLPLPSFSGALPLGKLAVPPPSISCASSLRPAIFSDPWLAVSCLAYSRCPCSYSSIF